MQPTADHTSGLMIDAADTNDRDDAIWVTRSPHGFEAWVHIAPVSAYLDANSTDDDTARRRMHTRYLPQHTKSMLPPTVERQASLQPATPQPTMAIHIRFSDDVTPLETNLTIGHLEQAGAITYPEAAAALDNTEHPHHHHLTAAHDLASRLLKQRRQRGSLAWYDLTRGYTINEEGQLIRLQTHQRNAGYIIVQELMIAANTAIAQWCAQHDQPILFRNHRMAAVAADKDELIEELIAAQTSGNTATYHMLQQRMNVVQRPATYGATVNGHHGLNLPAYTHATSPLRRYADLVNQRIITAAIRNEPSPYQKEHIEELGIDLTTRLQQERQRRSERHKQEAKKTVAAQLASDEFTSLDATTFAKVLRAAIEAGTDSDTLIAEAARRNDNANLSPREVCDILTRTRTPAWAELRHGIINGIANTPTRAITLLAIYAQNVVAGPIGEDHIQWTIDSIGTDTRPCFQASVRLNLPDSTHTSPQRRQHTKRDAKAHAALALLANLADTNDPSASVEPPPPTPRNTAPAIPAAGRNPAMIINELAQQGTITNVEWSFSRYGTDHQPSFTCTVTATLVPTNRELTGTGTQSSKQLAKVTAAAALHHALTNAPAPPESACAT